MRENDTSSNSLSPILFSPHLSPVNLALVAASKGAQSASPAAAFSYTDLACGNGLALCALAECYPWASFRGYDADKRNVDVASRVAASVGLKNVSFGQIDLKGDELPTISPSDFVVASGQYSWVSGQERQHLNDVASEALSEIGVFAVHYAAKPGMVQVDAMYDLMRIIAGRSAGQPTGQIQQAFKTIDSLCERNSALLANNSPAFQIFSQLKSAGLSIAEREVLGAGQKSFWFEEVADALEDLGLVFLGPAQLTLNPMKLRVPVEHRDFLMGIDDRQLRETVADVLTNAVLRIDVFGRRDASSRAFAAAGYTAELFAYASPFSQEQLSIDRLAQSTGINLQAPHYRSLIDQSGPKGRKLGDLLADNSLQEYEPAELWDALLVLLALNVLEVGFQRDRRMESGPSGQVMMATPLNKFLLEEYTLFPQPIAFSGPAFGRPILLGAKERLVLYSICGGDVAELWDRLGDGGLIVHDAENNPVASLEHFESILSRDSEPFIKNILPQLIRFGAITSVPPGGPQ